MFRVAQISDSHLSRVKPFFVANFHRIAEAIAADAPDLAVNTGDISLDGAGREDDLAAARAAHAALTVPVQFLPGNHDLGDNIDVAALHGHAIDAERRARYIRHFGADWWSVDAPGWRLIGVDAQLVGSGLAADDEQLAFVAEAAAGAGERRIALFVHKPLFDREAGEPVVGGRFLNPVPRKRLLDAFASRMPAVVASGHVHQYRAAASGGTTCVWAPSTAFYLPDAVQPRYGIKEVGYVVHAFHPDGRHDCAWRTAPGTENLCLRDFPAAYGA